MDGILVGGVRYELEAYSPEGVLVAKATEHNLVPTAGLNHIAGMILGSGPTPVAGWFAGIFENNYVPTATVTSADLQTLVGETTAYTETARPQWNAAFDGSLMSDPAEQVFTLNAAKTIRGAFLVASSTKGGNTGVLLSIARFASPFTLTSGSSFRVRPFLTLTTTQV